jgi:hypothetical protein
MKQINKMMKWGKKAQEEMVGFAIIIIVVAIIILIFVSLTITKPQKEGVESYEVDSYLQALLQSSTTCADNMKYLSVQDLIFKCKSGDKCVDGRDTCQVLEEEARQITSEAWQIVDRPVKAYELKILSANESIITIAEGNKTNNYKAAYQLLPKETEIQFKAYYAAAS